MDSTISAAMRLLGMSEPINRSSLDRLFMIYATSVSRTDDAMWCRATALFLMVRGVGLSYAAVAAGTGESSSGVKKLVRTFEAFPDPAKRPVGLRFAHFYHAAETKAPQDWIGQASGMTVPEFRGKIAEAKRLAREAEAYAPVQPAVRAALLDLLKKEQPITASMLQKIATQHRTPYASVLGALGALKTPRPNSEFLEALQARVVELTSALAACSNERQRLEGVVLQLQETLASSEAARVSAEKERDTAVSAQKIAQDKLRNILNIAS